MKKMLVLFLLALNLLVQAHAAEQEPLSNNKPSVRQQCPGQVQPRSFLAVGIVRKIDPENGIVLIFHESVAALMWPPMTMPFAVRDRVMFDRFSVGEKVMFEFVMEARNGVIVCIK